MAASLSATVTAASVGKASRRHHRRISHTVTTKAQRTWTTPAGTGRHLDGVRGGGGEGGGAAAVPLDRDRNRNLFAMLLPPMASDNANMLTLGELGGGLAISPGAAAELRYERRGYQGQHNAGGSAAKSTTSSYSPSQSGWADGEDSFGGSSERDSSVNGSMSATGSMCSETEQSDHE
jgi:hypothetical protein